MKKQRKNVNRFLTAVFASVLLLLVIHSDESKFPEQQEGAVCYSCNDPYTYKNPFDDKDEDN